MDSDTILALLFLIVFILVFAKDIYEDHIEPLYHRLFRRLPKEFDSSVRYISHTDICIELSDKDYIFTKSMGGRVFLQIPSKTSNVNYVLIEFKKFHVDTLKDLIREISR